jgi:hypothetical protein
MNTTAEKHGRLTERLMDYWQSIRQGQSLPLESDVDVDALKDIWRHCFLVSVHQGKFAYSYLGADLIEAYGDDITGHEIAETLLFPHPTSLHEVFKKVAATGVMQNDESEFVNARGAHVKYRSCVLPLAAHGQEGVAFLLGGMNWKAYE